MFTTNAEISDYMITPKEWPKKALKEPNGPGDWLMSNDDGYTVIAVTVFRYGQKLLVTMPTRRQEVISVKAYQSWTWLPIT